MGSVWLKNFLGIHCSDYELLGVPRPRTEFGIHITFKTVQWGVLTGTLVGPCLHILRYGASNQQKQLKDVAITGGLYGAGLGMMAGPLLSFAYYNPTMSTVERFDQCYRLRYNRPQLNIDRMSTFGGLIGGGLAGWPGFVAGMNVGVLCGLLLSGVQSIHFKI